MDPTGGLNADEKMDESVEGPEDKKVEIRTDKKCIICYDRQPTAFFFPCGHTSCLACALHIEANGGKCPHCRGQITKVRSNFNDFTE